MAVFEIFSRVLIIIAITLSAFFGAILLLSILFKLNAFLSLKFKPTALQKGELIKKKFFVCRDNYHLKWFGEINPKGKIILLGIHDLGMSSKDFLSFQNYCLQNHPEISMVSFDQRNFGENKLEEKRNAGSMILDLSDIVIHLKERYPRQKIILLGEGLGFYVASYVASQPLEVEKVVAIGLKNHQPYKNSFSTKWNIFLGVLFSPYKLIKINGEGRDMSSNPSFAKEIDNNLAKNGQISVREYFQHKQLVKHSVQKLQKLSQPLLVLQGQNDIYVNVAKTSAMIDRVVPSNFSIKYFSFKKHFLLNEPDNLAIFKIIIEWVR